MCTSDFVMMPVLILLLILYMVATAAGGHIQVMKDESSIRNTLTQDFSDNTSSNIMTSNQHLSYNRADEEDNLDGEVGPWPHETHGPPAAWERAVSAALHSPAALLLAIALAAAAALRPLRASAHARALACHAAALLLSTAMQLWWTARKEPASAECYAALLTYQFSYLAAYFWLNAMCVDMYLAFRVLTGPATSENSRFIAYSLYAWGLPASVAAATAAAQFTSGSGTSDSPNKVHPFSPAGCYFYTNEALFMYLYGPVSALLIINLLLFVLTALRIHQLHRDTAILDPKERGTSFCGQGRATLYVRLLWSMGVVEMAVELVSWDQGRGTMSLCIRSVVDLCRAVSVFIVLCCRGEVLRELLGQGRAGDASRRSGSGGRSSASAVSRQGSPPTPRISTQIALQIDDDGHAIESDSAT